MSDPKPLISTTVPGFNGEPFIAEAMESVICQTYESWKLPLVDDGSSDNSIRIAQEYFALYPEKIRLLQHRDKKNHGTGAARNLVIKNARGEFIANIDQDDIWDKTKLETQIKVFLDNPQSGMTFGPMIIWSS